MYSSLQHTLRSVSIATALTIPLLVLFVPTVRAQDTGLTFTVTPPIFQLNLQPGETWTSGVRVVNSNPYDITIYAEPVLFRPTGESGRPSFFIPEDNVADTPDRSTLAGWITVSRTAITIPQEQTVTIPLAVSVPDNAAPGGHYAAVLIGNRPPKASLEGGTVSVSSSIASLMFLRVAGDVIEDGRIRSFSTERTVYETAEARLSLRFENEGNVHLRPQGDITIYNMFGKKRGFIPVNQANDYGNVLPGSIRKFTFSWESSPGTLDIGRYRAEATIGYGDEAKQFAQSTIYFYVLPLVPILQIVGGLVMFIMFIGWAIRAYIRRALVLETSRVGSQSTKDVSRGVTVSPEADAQLKLESLILPIKEGMIDLRRGTVASHTYEQAQRADRHESDRMTFTEFMRAYRFFFLFIVVLAVGWLAANAFLADVLTVTRDYRAIEERSDGSQIELYPMNTFEIDQ